MKMSDQNSANIINYKDLRQIFHWWIQVETQKNNLNVYFFWTMGQSVWEEQENIYVTLSNTILF